jgi:hypothetical protein
MTNPLFSTYRQGENRVTGTVLAAFEHCNSALLEDVLESLLDESDFPLLTFENQPVRDGSVPDAVIRSSAAIYVETKTAQDAVDRDQLERHLKALDADSSDKGRLVVLTPDAEPPAALPDDERIVWANFDALVEAVESVLGRDVGTAEDSVAVPTEREAFLLRELVRFIESENLTSDAADRVIVVAARRAWPEYQQHGLYFCQSGRYFDPAEHIAFYTDGEIKTEIPRILSRVDDIELTPAGVEEHEGLTEHQREQLSSVVAEMRREDGWRIGEVQQVFFLEEDLSLTEPIQNDKTAESGRSIGFVQGHRYVSLNDLEEGPTYTSELE